MITGDTVRRQPIGFNANETIFEYNFADNLLTYQAIVLLSFMFPQGICYFYFARYSLHKEFQSILILSHSFNNSKI